MQEPADVKEQSDRMIEQTLANFRERAEKRQIAIESQQAVVGGLLRELIEAKKKVVESQGL